MDKAALNVQFSPGPINCIAHPAGDLHVAKANDQSSVFTLLDLSAACSKVNPSLLHDTILFSLVSMISYSLDFPSTSQALPSSLVSVAHVSSFPGFQILGVFSSLTCTP